MERVCHYQIFGHGVCWACAGVVCVQWCASKLKVWILDVSKILEKGADATNKSGIYCYKYAYQYTHNTHVLSDTTPYNRFVITEIQFCYNPIWLLESQSKLYTWDISTFAIFFYHAPTACLWSERPSFQEIRNLARLVSRPLSSNPMRVIMVGKTVN